MTAVKGFLLKIFGLMPVLVLVGFAFEAKRLSLAKSRTLEQANRYQVLLLNVGTEPRTLDPDLNQGIPEGKIISCLMEGLVADDPSDSARQQPGVADRWEHNEDYSDWTFHIRDNARWSNGDPVTADDFLFSYERALSPQLGNPFAEYMFILKGAEDFHKGKIKDFAQVGVTAIDAHTLRFVLVGPTPFFLGALTFQTWLPLNRATILRFGPMTYRNTKWTLPENFVGNGAFKLKSWRKNDVIEMIKSQTYWDAASVKLNGVNFYAITDANTQERAFRAGQLHATNEVPLDKVPYYRRNYPTLIRVEPFLGVYFYRFNVQRKPLDDPKVRLALSLAIDREAIVRNVLRAGEEPATGYTPPGFEGYPALSKIAYDPDRARHLLGEAGFQNGDGFPRLKILINTSEAHKSIAEAIQQMWKEELNIDIEIENQEWKVYIDSQNRMNYDIARVGWIAGYMDPTVFLTMWTTGNGNNNTHWSSPQYDALISLAARIGDPNARLEILHRAEEILLNDSPMIPIYWYRRVYLMDPSVKGWNALALDKHPLKYVELKQQ